ncbi:hypothetical protein GCM10007897_40580 [Sphingobium jiangsuense]|uniref:Uncharacterized protein n=1 Tax=Sphingobium jiangsuense TaxID=870476 RepID=A0A7W6BHS6_9SPHN|nr:hypothetical protein [Sphingobium jiangsuense]GLT02639.1 hypothetical protein GCM10007897_40580 [Sphingobium jiangsuense]
MDEHVLAAVIANDEAEALLPVEEFDDAGAFADDLGRHAAEPAATATAAPATAEAAAIAAAETATVTEAATAAEAAAIIAETATIAETAAETAAIRKTAKIVAAEIIPFVPAASAATSIKTHALLVTFTSPALISDEHAGRKTCIIRRAVRSVPHYISFVAQG